ncbi:MAG: carboxypeptidase-like regulatory domain-containing protein, partial [Myxococcota bacterium]
MLSSEAAAAQQGTIAGSVVSADTQEPLAGATITIVGLARGAVAGADGSYRLTLVPGLYTVRATFLGYSTAEEQVTVVAGQTVDLTFRLEISPLAIDQ